MVLVLRWLWPTMRMATKQAARRAQAADLLGGLCV
jgi:hypothetical protein